MKTFLAILLAITFIFQSASKLFIVAHYELNKDFIAKKLCENKSKPKMHCNGKCHMKKQLQKEDKKENSTPMSAKEKLELQFVSEIKNLFPSQNNCSEKQTTFFYLFSTYNKHTTSIYHPPQA